MNTLSRRSLLAGSAAAAAAGLLPRISLSQPPTDAARSADLITNETQRAIDRGLAWLAKRQMLSGANEGAFGHGGYPGGVAVCSLAGLAFMCSGSPPGQGPFGKNIDRCVKFISYLRAGQRLHLASPAPARTTCTATASPRCSSPRSTACRTGPTSTATVGDKLRKAVKLTCQCQNDAGGWRYQPVKSDADLSVTICQIMALRAARDAGIYVPDEVRTKCIDYVKNSQNADGGFRYQISRRRQHVPAHGGGRRVAVQRRHLRRRADREGPQVPDELPARQGLEQHAAISSTATTTPCRRCGTPAATTGPSGTPPSATRCSPAKAATARWPDAEVCPEYGTAMACIILQMPNNYLPIFSP